MEEKSREVEMNQETEQEQSRLMSRRDVLKLGGLATISAVGVSGLAACSPAATSSGSSGGGGGTGGSELTHTSVEGKWAFEIPPDPIAEDKITETREAEIIIIGAGTAGLSCAVAAAQAGGKVILFAKGKGPIGRGGSNFGFHSKYRESLGLKPVEPYPFIYNQLATQAFTVDQDKWYKWYQHSEEHINWLIDIMAETGKYQLFMEQIGSMNRITDPDSPEYIPVATHAWITDEMQLVGDGQPFVVQTLADKAVSLGAKIYYNTCAQQLVRGGKPNGTEGRVEAVIATDADGNYIKFVGTKAIVMATGDFSINRDMMKKYCPHAYDWVTNFDMGEDFDPENGKVYGGLYDGIGQRMGLWIGAAWQKNYPNTAMGGGFGGPGAGGVGITLNEKGKRFFCEAHTLGFNTMFMRNHVYGNKTYQIWDTAFAETGQPWSKGVKTGYTTPLFTAEEMIENWDKAVEEGRYVKADTIEEVVSKLGLPPETVNEVARYNKFCETGVDLDFYKNKVHLIPIKTGPFYGGGGETGGNFLTVLGGLRTDIDMKVCDKDDKPIPGLYNIGTMVGDTYFATYTFRISGQNLAMNCGTFGKLTGEYIVANE